MYAPVQPLVLTSAEWKNADFALLNGEIAWELESAISSTGTGQNIIYSDVLTGNVYMLRGDGAQVKGGSGYARLRVSLASFTVKDSGGNTVDIEDHINKIDGSAHGISGLISAATNGVLKGTDIIDSLVSDSAVKVLSAKQGKALQTNLGNHAGITNGSAHGINTLIGAHNTAAEAHADIRSAAGSAQSKADTADGKIDTHAGIENGSAHGINTLIGAHNTAAEAHADIRARIDDGLDDLNSALADHRSDTEAHLIPDQLAEGIAAHNEDEAAHPDILEDIYAVQRSAGDLTALTLGSTGEYLRIADVTGFAPEDLHELAHYQRMSDAEPEGDGGLREADHLAYQPAGNYQPAGDYAGQADFEELYGLVLSTYGEGLRYLDGTEELRLADGQTLELRELDQFDELQALVISAYGDALRFVDNEAGSAEGRLLDGLTADFRELDRAAPDGAFMSDAVWADWTPL